MALPSRRATLIYCVLSNIPIAAAAIINAVPLNIILCDRLLDKNWLAFLAPKINTIPTKSNIDNVIGINIVLQIVMVISFKEITKGNIAI